MKFLARLFKRRGEEGVGIEERRRYLELERRLVRRLVETRSVLLHDDVLDAEVRQVLGRGGDLRRVAKRLGLVKVYEDGERVLYIYVPFPLNSEVVKLVRSVVKATYLRASLNCLNEVVAAVLQRHMASSREGGDPLPWYHGTLISIFRDVVDEVLDMPGYLSVRYYRVGDVWIRETRMPCNEFTLPYDESICVEYDYVVPLFKTKISAGHEVP